ncbi:hypothetical protein POM88_047515 [Heracleum sosnowskyi]|uniref:polynucleotide adenylyltransferase n=1 Tax=Heracleum sosnowskyi TaxID=360622 RepID=A0AAD8LZN5_9APIA|nr:hypothetical protein POM88_047515 [Heracleum sosnowskyi]
MRDRKSIPSQDETEIRARILEELQKEPKKFVSILTSPAKENSHIFTCALCGRKELSVVLVPYGSYDLKVYNGRSDIDILLIAPELVSMESDFFVILRDHIETILLVDNMRSVRGAKVPLLKFSKHGIDVDIACARLKTHDIPRVEEFELATCFLKDWVDSRGINGNINCYLGGVHLVMMVAHVYQKYGHVVKFFGDLISSFFATFATWSWEQPVLLNQDVEMPSRRGPMLIHQPGTKQFCHSNVTSGTLRRISGELLRGHQLILKVLSYEWSTILDKFSYEAEYSRFIKVKLSVADDNIAEWMSFIKSRIHVLVRSLEVAGIYCDPNLVEFRDTNMDLIDDNNIVLFWGIIDDTGKKLDLTVPQLN